MRTFNRPLVVAVVLTAAASLAALPAHATDDRATSQPKIEQPERDTPESEAPEREKPEKAKVAEKAKPTCTATELAAYLAGEKASTAEKAKHKAEKAKHTSEKAEHKAEKAKHKSEEAKHTSEDAQPAHEKEVAHGCAAAKQHAAEKVKKEVEKKARARKFQAIGIVDSADAATGTVTVMIKAGSPDLHGRKLAIKVTAETRIQLDDEKIALAGLVKGTFVSVHGVRHEGTLVAAKINAASPESDDDDAADHDVSDDAPPTASAPPAAS